MPYNVAPSSPPMLSSSGNWMTLAQIISGLVGGNSNPTAPTSAQNSAMSDGQGPLSATSASGWQSSLTNTLANTGNGVTSASTPPGYNTNQFGVPLGAQGSNSY